MRLLSALLVVGLALVVPASAQILDDSFDYTVDGNLTDNGWTSIESGTSVTVTAASLSYAGYPAADVGNSIGLDFGDESVMRAFTPQQGGVAPHRVYFSFLIRVSGAALESNSGMFFWVGDVGTTIFTPVFAVKADRGGPDSLRFGLSANGGSSFTGYDFSLDTTNLIVVMYLFGVEGPTGRDDYIHLWVNPSLSEEPIPPPHIVTYMNIPAFQLAELVITGNDSSNFPPISIIDGVRVTTSWDELATPYSIVFTDDFENGDTSRWTTP